MAHEAAPVVVCITSSPAERARLAGRFDGTGILVLAPDAGAAGRFLRRLAGADAGAATGAVAGPGPAAGTAATPPAEDVVRVGGLALDFSRHEATWHGRGLPLTPYEFKVLGCLAGRPGQVWTYHQLHERAWGGSYFAGPAAVQSVIKRLRAKLRVAGASVTIRSTRGVGFRLDAGPDLKLVRPADPDALSRPVRASGTGR
ncbi:winged helix-turn-helix domain-containing protein [Jiangella alkaliphila]|uniref:Transcriptional regulatory protein, C terminal n=1 Tax=Jiangella alkaliphila TaxID=419479 RepID=A0A1H2KVB0_9ACTN|nr:winged helix-turn-helix domain-containing protein [Jiangella alkaliphila]SDU72281.1 Transcriptional regulatory protein, C terminal [Jiangella alkaliphila]